MYLETPWPEIYQDLNNVLPVLPCTDLRTQLKNIKNHKKWHDPKDVKTRIKIRYGKEGILSGMFQCLQLPRNPVSLPSYGDSPIKEKYAIIRPVSVRSEWINESRNPLPEYIYQASIVLKKAGYTIVSIADLEKGKEWAIEPLPYADISYHKGELQVKELLRHIEHASAVVGGIGFIVPAVQAYKVPAFIVCGGNGGYNSPSQIIDPKINGYGIHFAVPDNFCLCTEKSHDCDKRISNYEQQLDRWIADLE